MAEELDTNIRTYTHSLVHTEKEVVRGTLPSYAIRYEEAFFPWKTKKKRLSAARFARLIINNGRFFTAALDHTSEALPPRL